MSGYSRWVQWLVWGLLLLTIFAIGFALILSQLRLRHAPLAVYGQVPPFRLTNQFNQPVTLESLRGHVWAADVIFTRCPGPCLKMSKEMSWLAGAVSSNLPVKFVTLTADPEFDTPEVLQAYAKRFGAVDDRWWFLTGPKSDLYTLAIDGLKLTVTENKPEERQNLEDLFIHSTYFILVDKQGRLRDRPYESTQPGVRTNILQAIRKLARER